MNVFYCLLIIFLITAIKCEEFVESDTLVFAQIIFRHGDRNPIQTYQNDPWKDEKYWPEGFGEITSIGKQHSFELGVYLRQRYFNLLPNQGSYRPDNIYIQSTDLDRTLMSAAYVLAGMFPPKNEEIWNESLMWQAIPIHTVPIQFDHVLAGERPCPQFIIEYKKYQQSSEYQLILKSSEKLFEYLEANSGEKIQTLEDVKELRDTLVVQKQNNYQIPDWAEEVYDDMELLQIFELHAATNTKLLARLKVGFLIQEILEHFTKKIDNTLTPNRSLWMYSAHDLTIMRVLNAMDLFVPHIPKYSSCLLFELHQFNETFYVEMYLKRDHQLDDSSLEQLDIPNCGLKCPLDRLYEIYQDILPDDFDTECLLQPVQLDSENGCSSIDIHAILWCFIGLIVGLQMVIF